MTPALLLVVAAAAFAVAGCAQLVRIPRARPATTCRATPGPAARLLRALGRIGDRLGTPAAPRDLEARLAAAGLASRVTAREVMTIKGGAAAVLLMAALPLAPSLSSAPVLVLAAVLVAPCLGFLAPDLWLRHRTAARAATASAELGDVVDLLRVAVDAGVSGRRAIAEVGRRRRGLLAAELRTTAARMELGVPLAAALAELVARCPVEGIGALAAAIERSDRHGAPLGPTLAALAARTRAERACRVREEAARAAPKIQLVVALLLVPAALLLVGAAIVVSLAH